MKRMPNYRLARIYQATGRETEASRELDLVKQLISTRGKIFC